MSEEKKNQEPEIPVWHTKVQPERKPKKKRNLSRMITAVLSAVILVTAGWIGGSLLPAPGTEKARRELSTGYQSDKDEKIDTVLDIMSHDWFFANQIDDVEERLVDQGLTGMTTNEEDPHTEYMSADEITSFTQSINRNFVGIGVQFTSTDDGMHIITNVFRDSPAEKAGVHAGDIIHAVDGTVVDGLKSTDIQKLVQGEEGTDVQIDLIRSGKTLSVTITRAQVSMTVSGEKREDGIGYLQIMQFGESTGEETKSYLEDFRSEGVTDLIIDLRSDGGGYLDALGNVISLFLPENTVYIQRVYSDGTINQSKTTGGMIEGFENIVLLVDENTASAAEAFTIAMKEQRDHVTIVGETTYGKGTVQVTKYFTDGSALKYTNSKWESPSGIWVNDKGITPDEIVKLHDFLYTSYTAMPDEESYQVDSVSDYVKEAQLALDFMGYEVDRTDGYFSAETETALKQFEKDHELTEGGILNTSTYEAIVSAGVSMWQTDKTKDIQLSKALEILNAE